MCLAGGDEAVGLIAFTVRGKQNGNQEQGQETSEHPVSRGPKHPLFPEAPEAYGSEY